MLTIFLLLFHLYCGTYGTPTNIVFLPIHLMTTLAILFLIHPLGRQWNDPLVPLSAIDLVCVAACLAIGAYFLDSIEDYQLRLADLRPIDRLVVDRAGRSGPRGGAPHRRLVADRDRAVLLRARDDRQPFPRRVLRAADLVRIRCCRRCCSAIPASSASRSS